MKKRIITISREFGSGGHSIGKAVAKRLGISFYDQALIEKIAADTGFSEEFIREASEYSNVRNGFLFNLYLNFSPHFGTLRRWRLLEIKVELELSDVCHIGCFGQNKSLCCRLPEFFSTAICARFSSSFQ